MLRENIKHDTRTKKYTKFVTEHTEIVDEGVNKYWDKRKGI